MQRVRRQGLTLVEALVSLAILSTLLISILGAFAVARISAVRAQNRLVAMNIAREYIEQEARLKYSDIVGAFDGYNSVADGAAFTRSANGITFTITPNPYDAAAWSTYTYAGWQYKIVGFTVTWTEASFGTGAGTACSERLVTYVAYHP